MQTLYFLTTSLNFSNIFATESISPEIFYSMRGFGFSNFTNIFPNIRNFIPLFEKLPVFDIQKSAEVESFKLVFELEFENIDCYDSKNGIWFCPHTIYLNNCLKKVYFFNENAHKRIIAKSESSKTLKTLNKYLHKFDYQSHNLVPFEKYNLDFAEPIENKHIKFEIGRDRYFNSFKGFIYCFLCGQLTNKNPNELKLFKLIQQIKNEYAVFKNNIAHSVGYSYSKEKNYEKNSSDSLFSNLKTTINEFENLFKEQIENFGEIDYKVKFLVENYGADNSIIEFAQKFITDLRITVNFDYYARNWYVNKYSNSPYVLFEHLKQCLKDYKLSKNTDYKDDLDSEISKSIFFINKYIEDKLVEKNKNKKIDLSAFEYISNNQPIKITKELLKINDDKNFYELIANILLKHSKGSNDRVNDYDLLNIIEIVGNETFGNGKASTLYKYFSHQIQSYEEPKTITNVFKNFTAFVFQPNEIDRLIKFVEEKKIDNFNIALSFFGAFNGFASLSKSFTSSIFDANQTEIIKYIDSYLDNLLQKINSDTIEYEQKIIPEIPITVKEETEIENNDNPKDSFLNYCKENIFSRIKYEIKKLPDDYEIVLSKAFTLINVEIERSQIPINSQQDYIKKKLNELLNTTCKMKNVGDKSVKKIIELIK